MKSTYKKTPQQTVACTPCIKLHAGDLAGVGAEAQERIGRHSENIDHERSCFNLHIHGLGKDGNPIINSSKYGNSLEERILGIIAKSGATITRDRSENKTSHDSVVAEGIILQVSHELAMKLMKEDGLVGDDGKIRRPLSSEDSTFKMMEDSYRFACDRWGAENIAGAYIHMDEYTPHLHIYVVPLTKKDVLYNGKRVIDKDGNPKVKAVLDAKNLFSPKTITNLWKDYAAAMKPYGATQALGVAPKGSYDTVASLDAVLDRKKDQLETQQENIRDLNNRILQASQDKEKLEKAEGEIQQRILRGSQKVEELTTTTREKKRELARLGMEISTAKEETERASGELESKKSHLRVIAEGSEVIPEKGILGYKTQDVDRYIEATQAKWELASIIKNETNTLKAENDELRKTVERQKKELSNPSILRERLWRVEHPEEAKDYESKISYLLGKNVKAVGSGPYADKKGNKGERVRFQDNHGYHSAFFFENKKVYIEGMWFKLPVDINLGRRVNHIMKSNGAIMDSQTFSYATSGPDGLVLHFNRRDKGVTIQKDGRVFGGARPFYARGLYSLLAAKGNQGCHIDTSIDKKSEDEVLEDLKIYGPGR